MSAKNIVETVNVNGELEINGDKWKLEKIRSNPCTVTIPPSKTCTSGTKLQSLWISIVEDDTITGVFREGTICDDMTWVVVEGTEVVWTVAGGVAKLAAKRTVVSSATILGVARGTLVTIGTLILWAVNMKMPCKVTVKTNSLSRHCGFWAQMGVLRCNMSGV